MTPHLCASTDGSVSQDTGEVSPIGLLQTLAESVRVAYVIDFLSLSLSENALLEIVNGKNGFPSNSFLKKKIFF